MTLTFRDDKDPLLRKKSEMTLSDKPYLPNKECIYPEVNNDISSAKANQKQLLKCIKQDKQMMVEVQEHQRVCVLFFFFFLTVQHPENTITQYLQPALGDAGLEFAATHLIVIRKVRDGGNASERFHTSSLTDVQRQRCWFDYFLFSLFLCFWRLTFDDLLCLTCVPR